MIKNIVEQVEDIDSRLSYLEKWHDKISMRHQKRQIKLKNQNLVSESINNKFDIIDISKGEVYLAKDIAKICNVTPLDVGAYFRSKEVSKLKIVTHKKNGYNYYYITKKTDTIDII